MRHARPLFSALTAHVWRATGFAALFTAGAGVLSLALPLLVVHAIEAAERRQSLDGLLLVAAVGLAAALLRSVLLAARDRILLQAALWLDHTAGAAVLSDRLERGVMPDALDRDRAALDRCVHAIAGPAVAALLDALAASVPLVLVFMIHPALGAVSLLVAAGLVASAVVRARACAHGLRTAGGARDIADKAWADKAWRTAAANAPMIAARRMSAGIVADWETLNRAAVVSAYTLAGHGRRVAALLRVADLTSSAVLAIVGVLLVLSDSLTLAALAGVVVLHTMLVRSVLSALDHVPELAALEAGLQHLGTSPAAMVDRALPSQPMAQSTTPAQMQPLAVASATPASVSNKNPTHPARPTFEPAAFEPATPLPTARLPAAYGATGAYASGAQRGGV